MPLVEIQPGAFRKIRYDAPTKNKVEISVEATGALDVFVVPASDIEKWRRGGDYGGDGFRRKKNLQIQMKVNKDFEDEWYLVLENKSDNACTAHYEVYEA
jgi:hypothetical protein